MAAIKSILQLPFILAMIFVALQMWPQYSIAAVLPEERADVMYHRYEGGGMVIDGPSVLVRKNIKDKVSLSANYYVDTVSSASIDVLTQGASRYSEERTEYSFDTAYLTGKTQFNIGFTKSDENDYEANSVRFDISHAFFSEMTTIGIGYSQGDDDIDNTRDAEFLPRELKRRNYRFNASQILSKNLLFNINYEAVIDEGYLQNPYRQIIETSCASSADDLASCPLSQRSATLAPELYPSTRNSDAYSIKFSYHLPWEAAFKTKLGYFSDSWGIDSVSLEFDYSHRFKENIIADVRIRYYDQGQADFYANQFFIGSTVPDFRARDKELSQHTSYSIGAGVSYKIELDSWLSDVVFNGQIDYFQFNYDNFLEYSTAINPSTDILGAPKYEFSAYALRIFATARF